MKRIDRRAPVALVGLVLAAGALAPGALASEPSTTAGTVVAAPRWALETPATSRKRTYGPAVAYDDRRKEVVSFGGFIGGYDDATDETWVWDGQDWAERGLTTHPSARAHPGMAYDSARGEMVLFGGTQCDFCGGEGDTWTLTDGDWVQHHPAHSPVERSSTMMAYDPTRQQVILFGGLCTCHTRYSDTWAWDGDDWTELQPEHVPSGRSFAGFAYDPSRDALVMFGGSKRRYLISQTWAWDGEDWTRQKLRQSPPGTYAPAMATFGRHVVIEGGSTSGDTSGGTWVLRKNSWQHEQLDPAPSGRYYAGMAWDSEHEQAVLFGGTGGPSGRYLSDTWTLAP